eukprot:755997-Hanusia_phi.AAC.3
MILAHALTLPQGLSLTTLKSVCRQLGVRRWPYTRGGYHVHEDARASLHASGQPDARAQDEEENEEESEQNQKNEHKEDEEDTKSDDKVDDVEDTKSDHEVDDKVDAKLDDICPHLAPPSHQRRPPQAADLCGTESCPPSSSWVLSEAWLAWYLAPRSAEEDMEDVIWRGEGEGARETSALRTASEDSCAAT